MRRNSTDEMQANAQAQANANTNDITLKMRSAGVASPTIAAFASAVRKVREGETGMLAEAAIAPVESLPELEAIAPGHGRHGELLPQCALVKLNGGLGTSMGLDRAKSLIAVKGNDTFLDFAVRQVFHLRGGRTLAPPAFCLMDSFSTQADTLGYLKKYPELAEPGRIDFLQNKVPKLDAATLAPVRWPANPELEWCPPGHGDIYPAMLGCGLLERFLQEGVRCLFVSNSDNLGATLDLRLARHFLDSGLSFLMEVAERTTSDRKGGHLTRRASDGRLVLRESAQCPKEDEEKFQDITRHRFFNTNNLWIRLDHLKAELERHEGALPLPLIKNLKTVDPCQADSPAVLQLESAMGAAIECFANAGAIVVPRARFAPVKTTSDLLALRSDAYRVTEDFRLVLDDARRGQPPVIDLEPQHYKLLPAFEELFAGGVPSLVGCDSLRVRGRVRFNPGVSCRGTVSFVNRSQEIMTVKAGTYADESRERGSPSPRGRGLG